jgi:hypothetical protein
MVIPITLGPNGFGSKFIILLSLNRISLYLYGGFQQYYVVTKKLGPKPANCHLISNLCCLVKDNGFFDLGYNVHAYTLMNKRFDSNPTYECLDRFLANAAWCVQFTNIVVCHLLMMKSDHAPILVVLSSSHRKTSKPFKFENWWLLTDDYENVAKASWKNPLSNHFISKPSFLPKI